MKQVIQTLKDGRIQVLDVPPPGLAKGMILVQNHYSLISPGTEGSTIRVAQKSLLGKAKERPQQVKQVIDVLKQQGPVQTYRAVRKKLDEYSPLGYSSAGEVIEVASDVKGFSVGDRVACGGVGYANHAEIVAVPQNLCVKLPPDSDLKKASFNTLGAIALQGIRQSDLKIGEACVVIGLGLVGQMTSIILRTSGIKVIGIDIDSKVVSIARKHCADLAFVRSEPGLERKIHDFTQSIGADAVIISAATESLDPINFAGRILRKRGRVVIVGDIPTGFDREPFYRKEIDVRMSCSYGPGRYDPNYEEKGMDYPIGYVRWTEKRNMEAFQELIHSGKIDIDYLMTHVFNPDDAAKAYDLVLKREEPFLGILFEYKAERKEVTRKIETQQRQSVGKINMAFIGAGSYAMSSLFPNIPKDSDVVLKGVMDISGTNAKTVADKYGFEFCTSDENDIFRNDEINTVYIATRHNSHAEYVIKSLKAGKHVAVEKPLCLREPELEDIKKTYHSVSKGNNSPLLMLGFNRRFSKLTEILKEHLGKGPMAMLYRINSGYIPPDSWIQDKDVGGGRILGEVCHFVDFLNFINESHPEYVFANVMSSSENVDDTVIVNLEFRNGSVGTIAYFSNGSQSLSKEYIEVYKTGLTGVIRNFKELEIYGNGKKVKKKLLNQDKGQKKMLREFIGAIKEGRQSPIGFEDIYSTTKTTFKIVESIRTKKAISLSE
jgi:predicted dehydrogenase/threonine dehydrogenase-like Zn-dependent dehydrogenase